MGELPVCTGTKNLVPTGIQSLDGIARGDSLYRLRLILQAISLILFSSVIPPCW